MGRVNAWPCWSGRWPSTKIPVCPSTVTGTSMASPGRARERASVSSARHLPISCTRSRMRSDGRKGRRSEGTNVRIRAAISRVSHNAIRSEDLEIGTPINSNKCPEAADGVAPESVKSCPRAGRRKLQTGASQTVSKLLSKSSSDSNGISLRFATG